MKTAVYEHKTELINLQHVPLLSEMPHFHKEIELIYIKKGGCIAHADRQIHTLECGELFINFPNQIHYYENSLLGEYYVIIINSNVFFELKDILNNSVPIENKIDLKNHEYIVQLLDDLYFAEGEYKNTVLAGILNQLLGLLLPKMELKPKIKTDNFTLQSILAFCADNFTEEISLDDISSQLHLSKYHISHLLSSRIGITFNSYINILRVDMACDLLQNTEKKTSTISEEVGFGSIRSFNRIFLQITKITPLKYRSKYKNQKI